VTGTWVIGRRVVAAAPVRVADVGGWTDTWFGSPGRVCSLAVGPGVEVAAEVVARAPGAAPVRLVAPALGLDAGCGPGPVDGWRQPLPVEHPLLAHAVAEVLEGATVPDDVSITLTITSAVPPGASLGTSASVVVAVLAALDALVGAEAGGGGSSETLARRAHQVETGRARREAGVQDQWAAALGGCLDLAVAPYPEVRARPVPLSPEVERALADRLVTVVFGAHDSSAVHQEVITAITGCGGADHDRARSALGHLAVLAGRAAAALEAGDLEGWGALLSEATDTQGRLHPSLVGAAHRRAIEIGVAAGAVGWKVNGAGGDGGSLTLLAGAAPGAADHVAAAYGSADRTWAVLRLGPGHHPRVTLRPG
jgi:D-glycero-alpha-D-manno-heptose-7-phosphate kinase